MIGRPHLAAMTAASLILLAGLAPAQDAYLPLALNNTWSYVDSFDRVEVHLVTGQADVIGGRAWVIEYPGSDMNADLENYWTGGADGDVLLHGFWRGWGYLYDPPVLLVDAPLEPGKAWSSTVDVYTLPDLTYDATVTFEFTVTESGSYEVPAGSFEAFGVDVSDGAGFAGKGGDYSLSGEFRGPAARTVAEWWSAGVGKIQYLPGGLYRLESYELQQVAVESRTWSDVKLLFD